MTPRRSIIPIFVPHLGCPHMCVFCNQNRISGEQSPARPEDVRKTIDDALRKLPQDTMKTVAFYGGSFTAISAEEQESLLEAVSPYIESGRISDIRLSTRPDAIDGEVIERLKRFGVKTVELGVQSMDEAVLKASNRGHTAEDARRAAKMLKAAGFELILQMMTGLPMDTAERSIATALEFIRLAPDGVRIYPTVIIKDTELYDLWRRGEYAEHSLEEAVELSATLLDIFEAAGIPVIRLGLNPTEELSAGDAAGGAYHPALRELAESRRYLRLERAALSAADGGRDVEFLVPKGKLSQAIGQRKENSDRLKGEFKLKSVRFFEENIAEKLIRRK